MELPRRTAILLLAGCVGGSSESAPNSSVPIETVERPAVTTTYSVPSSSMEPTLHCARPGLQAAVKCLYLTIRSLDPRGRARARWINRWKPALNAFAVTFEGRIEITN